MYNTWWIPDLDGVVDFFGIVVGWASHQADDKPLKFTRQLILQIINEVLLHDSTVPCDLNILNGLSDIEWNGMVTKHGHDQLTYLAKAVLVRSDHFLSLCVAPCGDQVQNGLFVATWGQSEKESVTFQLTHRNSWRVDTCQSLSWHCRGPLHQRWDWSQAHLPLCLGTPTKNNKVVLTFSCPV